MIEGNKDAAVGLYRHALLVLDPPNPVYDKMRGEIDELVNSLAPISSKTLVKKGPVPKKK
jgi:hypothetical protein